MNQGKILSFMNRIGQDWFVLYQVWHEVSPRPILSKPGVADKLIFYEILQQNKCYIQGEYERERNSDGRFSDEGGVQRQIAARILEYYYFQNFNWWHQKELDELKEEQMAKRKK